MGIISSKAEADAVSGSSSVKSMVPCHKSYAEVLDQISFIFTFRLVAEKNERHHGDALWFSALAVRAAGVVGKETRWRRAVKASVV